MVRTESTQIIRKLVLKFILDNIDYRKKSMYLQDIISLGRKDEVWLKALAAFFDTPLTQLSPGMFSKN